MIASVHLLVHKERERPNSVRNLDPPKLNIKKIGINKFFKQLVPP